MEKKLDALLSSALGEKDYTYITNIKDALITSLIFDSRKAKKGALYFSWPGVHEHGNKYIPDVINSGVAAVIFQDDIPDSVIALATKKNVSLVKVPNSRHVMSPISAAFFDNPSEKLVVIGVTGTEGKSTTVYLIWQFLQNRNYKAGFISTVQYSLGDEALDNPEHQTTPESPIVQEQLYKMVMNGCVYAIVESSSHGLSDRTNRLGDVHFDTAVMMNVTHEHLEFHGTFEQYRNDKANLFRMLDKNNHKKVICGKLCEIPSFGVVNLEDKSASYFVEATKKKVYGFTTNGEAGAGKGTIENAPNIDFYSADNINSDSNGVSFNLTLPDKVKKINFRINLPGAYNVYNTIASLIVVTINTGLNPDDLVTDSTKLKPVTGRMTMIQKGQPFEVIVDYAHTPSSFNTIFPPLKKRAKARIISLFGSGGERDIKKRPEQGKIAAEFCDIVILTDEDPRGEDSYELLEMIATGCESVKINGDNKMIRDKNFFIIPDRPTAIRKAFSIAQKDDIVLLLGKSHENSIIYKNKIMPYNEIKEANKALEEQGYLKGVTK